MDFLLKYSKKAILTFDRLFNLNLYNYLSFSLIKYSLVKQLNPSGYRFSVKNNLLELSKGKKVLIFSIQHLLYTLNLKDYFEYYFASLKPLKKNGFEILDFSKPNKHTFKKSDLSFFFTSIPEDEWEIDHYCDHYKIKKGDIVFDLGSYCGYSVFGFSKFVGNSGKVIAFEPDDRNYKYLLLNIKNHKLSNVMVIKEGIWSKNTVLEFYQEGSLGSSLKEIGYRSENVKSTKIKVLTLASAFQKLDLKKLDFVKMDIEGAELEAVQGSLDFIRKHDIRFAISCHERSGSLTSIPLKKIFNSIGYCSEAKTFKFGKSFSYMLYAEKKNK